MTDCKGHIKLFFIRHAFSCANFSHRKSPLLHTLIHDPKLASAGIEDIQAYRKQFASIKPEYVFSSNLLRAIQTAEFLFPNNKIYVSPYIGESGLGRDNKPSKPTTQRKNIKDSNNVVYAYLGEGSGIRLSGEELDKRFEARKADVDVPNFGNFLTWLNTKIPPGKDISIAVVGHSDFMRKMMIERRMASKDVHKLKNDKGGKIRNGGVVEINLCHRDIVLNGKPATELYPYTKNCPPINTFTPVVESMNNFPCYGVRLLGIPEPNIKTRNFKNC
jgi:broad specificity phosphatase PhoE